MLRKMTPRRAALTALSPRQRKAERFGEFVHRVHGATPGEWVEIERQGIPGTIVKDLARQMNLPATRFYVILGLPKATVEKKASQGEQISGAGGFAALGVVKLLGRVQELIADSTAPGTEEFDAGKWFGEWIERPQPALGGKRPADLLDTPTGFNMVNGLLGAIRSGAYL